MKYYIGHIHQHGKTSDKIYVEDLAAEKKILEEKVNIEDVDSRLQQLQETYTEHNLLHFYY